MDSTSPDESIRRFPIVPLPPDEFETDPLAVRQAGEAPRIPGYEILGVLGRGGMGVVYHARQLNPPRPVALKVVLAGAHASAEALARFRREAEAAAALQHPHITQVYEVGEIPAAGGGPSGLPYFSLEFVSGGTLAQRTAGKPQAPRAAAELVRTLAGAVHYAHERGLIHRDLKPANILLQSNPTTDGTDSTDKTLYRDFLSVGSVPSVVDSLPKITDFGLAKHLAADTQLTRSGDVLGTPSYMAPEQAGGKVKEIGPATDVYGLGAILYELLTGRPPFLAETTAETLLLVLWEEPVSPRRLQLKVPRDLETICLKCLRKQPHRRYASARELADDLGRYLDGLPVRARPTPPWERAVKWARRRPAAAGLLGLALLAALGLLLGGLWHTARLEDANERLGVALRDAEERRQDAERASRRAEANFARARGTVDEMVSWVGQERLTDVPHMERARRDILQKALRLYQDLAREQGDDPATLWRVGFAHARVAEAHRLLGQPQLGEKAYAEALSVLHRLAARFPDSAKYQETLARTHYNRAILRKDASRPAGAERDARAAIGLHRRLAADKPADPQPRSGLASALGLLGILHWQAGRRGEAEQAYREAIELQRGLAADHPTAPAYRHRLAVTLSNFGWLLANASRQGQAEECYREALRLHEKLAADSPASAGYRQDLAGTLHNLGLLLGAAGRKREAESVLRRARDLRAGLTADFPARPDYRRELALTCHFLAELLWDADQSAEAERCHGEALAACERLVTDFPESAGHRALLTSFTRRDLPGRLRRHRPVGAETAYRQVLAVYERLAARLPDVPDWQRGLGETLESLAHLAADRKDMAEAARLFRRAGEHRRAFLKANPADPDAHKALLAAVAKLAEALLRAGEHAEAARAAGEYGGLAREGWQGQVWAAGLLARCIPAAAKDARLPDAERARLAQVYGDWAVERLREAGKRGLPAGPGLGEHPAFAPLLGRPDFQKLCAELAPGG